MTPETITHEEENRSSAEIQSEIRETRGRMDATLDELGNRLTARSLFTSALDWWDSGNQGSTAAKNALKTVYHQAKEHPMPALLIGSGIAWLVSETMSGDDEKEIGEVRGRRLASRSITRYRERRDPSDRYDIQQDSPGMMEGVKDAAAEKFESARETARETKAQLAEKAHQVGDKVQQATDKVNQQAHEALDRGKELAVRLKEDVKESYESGAARFEQACEEHPLAVGVAFAALGALAGLALPRTSKEDELMGEQSDMLVDETKEKANELLESGKVVGSRVMEAVKQEAEEQGLTGSHVAEKISGLAQAGTQVVQKAKDEVMQAAEDEGLKQSSRRDEPSKSSSDPNCGCS